MSSSVLMARPPCCEKADVKKGPWTPEEDLVLGSYIQEHGPGSWKDVPTKTGLMRCSKSCRLRWTNYLRPGIKRGNFTEQEEKLIVHLQALFGNRWATIASYLPERTDNDVKNYWNTHLKKKLNIIQTLDQEGGAAVTAASQPAVSKGRWETRVRADIHMAKRALDEALALALQDKPIGSASASAAMTTTTTTTTAAASTTTYASSAENIARLLRGWMENRTSSPKTTRSYYSTSTGASSSATAATSQNNFPISSAMDSSSLLFDLDARNLERSETDLSHGDVKIPNLTYSLFESWLFEEEESMDISESFAYV